VLVVNKSLDLLLPAQPSRSKAKCPQTCPLESFKLRRSATDGVIFHEDHPTPSSCIFQPPSIRNLLTLLLSVDGSERVDLPTDCP
jgi:hypothetical protein